MQLRQLIFAIISFALFAPASSLAGPIKFSWTSDGASSTLLSGSGYWIVDESDLSDGVKVYLGLISEFEFNWETNVGSFTSSSAAGDQVAIAVMNLSGLDVMGFDICVSSDGSCAASTGHPLLRASSGLNLWAGTSGPGMPNFASGTQTATATKVPEPATILLLGAGLLGLGLSRRRSA